MLKLDRAYINVLGMKKLVFVLSKTATSECGILVRVMLRDGSRARART